MKLKIQDVVIKKKTAPIEKFKERNYFSRPKKSEKSVPTKKSIPEKRKTKISKGKVFFGIVLFILLLIVGAKIVSAFSKAIIQIQLHQETVEVNTILRGLLVEQTTSDSGSYDLTIQTMELKKTEKKSIPATGSKIVEKKASGQIVIYNAYSSKPQPLIKNTRFETPDGKIYRIQKRITVPGAKVENGKIIPSSIEATVYADQAGEEYNIDLMDFTIPGFKGSPRYKGFYARSKTPMRGGFKGEVPTVSEKDEQELKETLEKNLKKDLWEKARAQTPDNFILYEGASQITFSNGQTSDINKGKFSMEKTGNFFAYLFNKKELSKALVKKYLGEDLVNKVEAQNLENLNVQIISRDSIKGIVAFKVKGSVRFVWTINEEKLKQSLVASPKNLDGVFKNYPAIEKASVVFKPSWWRFFPKKASQIEIEVVNSS